MGTHEGELLRREGAVLAVRDCGAEIAAERDNMLDLLLQTQRVLERPGSQRAKFKAAMVLVKDYRGNKELLFAFLKASRKWLWEERNWSQRLAIVGGAAAYVSVGALSAGLATAGMGIAIPVAIVVAGGGSLVGNMIDAVNQSRNEQK